MLNLVEYSPFDSFGVVNTNLISFPNKNLLNRLESNGKNIGKKN